jgi:hypothetical protein
MSVNTTASRCRNSSRISSMPRAQPIRATYAAPCPARAGAAPVAVVTPAPHYARAPA